MVVTVLFGVGLFLSMARAAWLPASSQYGLLAFFGFGVPMVLLAWATFALWDGNKNLQNQIRLGLCCIRSRLGTRLVWACCRLGQDGPHPPRACWLLGARCAFRGSCGGVAIAIVVESDAPPTREGSPSG